MGTFYFDIEVINVGDNVCVPEITHSQIRFNQPNCHTISAIGIGIMSGDKKSSLSQMPGWEAYAWGYHGDDGKCFSSGGLCRVYAEVWATGDVIGCHVNLDNGELFFTRNGESLGWLLRNPHGIQQSLLNPPRNRVHGCRGMAVSSSRHPVQQCADPGEFWSPTFQVHCQ